MLGVGVGVDSGGGVVLDGVARLVFFSRITLEVAELALACSCLSCREGELLCIAAAGVLGYCCYWYSSRYSGCSSYRGRSRKRTRNNDDDSNSSNNNYTNS